MSTLPLIPITSEDWVDLYAESGLTTGTKLTILNRGTCFILLQESSTKPVLSSIDGELLSTVFESTPRGFVKQGSSKIWAICVGEGKNSSLSVQEDS